MKTIYVLFLLLFGLGMFSTFPEKKVIIAGKAATSPQNNLIQITSDTAPDIHVKLSPDGTKIAFMSERSGKQDIWIKSISNGKLERFTEVSDNSWPSWSPDGGKIAFSSNRTGNNDIWVKAIE